MPRKKPSTEKAVAVNVQSAIPAHLLEKRSSMVDARDNLLSQIQEMDAVIGSLDTVISLYDPKHVPIDIRTAYSRTPLLTSGETPFLTQQAEPPVAPKEIPKPKAVPQTKTPRSQPDGGIPGVILTDEDRAKQKKKVAAKKKKKTDAVRGAMADYYSGIDQVRTIIGILEENPQGLPFRKISEAFREKYPIDLPTAIHRKVFGDKISNALYLQSVKGVVKKGVIKGENGEEQVWIATGKA